MLSEAAASMTVGVRHTASSNSRCFGVSSSRWAAACCAGVGVLGRGGSGPRSSPLSRGRGRVSGAVSGALLSPKEALGIGLVDELVPLERVVDRAVEWCQGLLTLPTEAMTHTRELARADLVAIFEADLEPELQRVIAGWWSAETQGTLRALVERLGKKAG